VPRVHPDVAMRVFRGLHKAITEGRVRACHDLSEGGLAVAAAEMAFAGGLGIDITHPHFTSHPMRSLVAGPFPNEVILFSESPSRFLVEVKPEQAEGFMACFEDKLLVSHAGQTVPEPRLRIAGAGGDWIVWASLADLKETWQKPLRW
jgi:phosphoribosylformylglycinamidine synthase subunit PurSL